MAKVVQLQPVRLTWIVFLLACPMGGVGSAAGQPATIEDIQNRSGKSAPARSGSAPAAVVRPPFEDVTQLPMDERMRRLERVFNQSTMLDMVKRLEEVGEQSQRVQSRLDELAHEMESLQQRQKDMYQDLDRRFQELEKGMRFNPAMHDLGVAPPPPVGISAPPSQAATGASDISIASGGSNPRAAYELGVKLLRAGEYDQAIQTFEKFLNENPESEYSANAQYWIGEANYVTRRFSKAEDAFKALVAKYPQSLKVPDAVLKLGFTYYDMQRWKESRDALDLVSRKYPDTSAARLANERLRRMTQEKH